MDKDILLNALKQVKYPGFSRDIVSFGLVKDIVLRDGGATLLLRITSNDPAIPARLREDISAALAPLGGNFEINIETQIASAPATKPSPAAPAAAPQPAPIPGIRRIIAVASGKGGVGKSTVAVNLACALAQAGHAGRVGLLDCDIYGPSIPLMTGLSGKRPEMNGDLMAPFEKFGLKIMSLGFLIDDDAPVIWRGPMIMKTIQQFFAQVAWGELDVLVVDLPPGTGDAPLSLAQAAALDGAVIVTTPQPAAAGVARRGAELFNRLNTPILGVVENMSYLQLPGGGRQEIFGSGGGEKIARELGVELLGKIPLESGVREGGDTGLPAVIGQPDSTAAAELRRIALKVSAVL